jgi:hypothetical protein
MLMESLKSASRQQWKKDSSLLDSKMVENAGLVMLLVNTAREMIKNAQPNANITSLSNVVQDGETVSMLLMELMLNYQILQLSVLVKVDNAIVPVP